MKRNQSKGGKKKRNDTNREVYHNVHNLDQHQKYKPKQNQQSTKLLKISLRVSS